MTRDFVYNGDIDDDKVAEMAIWNGNAEIEEYFSSADFVSRFPKLGNSYSFLANRFATQRQRFTSS
jgi:hypothetical protein